jgi:hypothetical protein
MSIVEFTTGGSGNTVSGINLPLPANGPYTALVTLTACYNSLIKSIGTSYSSPLVMNASVTGLGVNATGNNDGITVKRVFLSNTRTGPYAFVNSDTNVVLEHVAGDTADTSVIAALNCVTKNAMLTAATTGQVSVYGTHWITRFTSTTAGFAEIMCNEPTTASATQCWAAAGTPQFNSSGQVLLTKVNDEVIWEMPFFCVGFTAFTNSAPTITGTNVTYSSGARWGNHDIYFQVDTGSGYGGTWLALTAANLTAQTFNSTTGFKLKVRAVCATASATNAITNMRVALTTTQTDRDTKLYPLSTITLTLTDMPTGCDVAIIASGTETVRATQEDLSGTTYAYTYETPENVDLVVIKPGYMPFAQRNFALGSSNASFPISLSPDPSYLE